jgi:hypothetical protein
MARLSIPHYHLPQCASISNPQGSADPYWAGISKSTCPMRSDKRPASTTGGNRHALDGFDGAR